ncbi:MAG: DUF5996 family protein [Anaerolineae bacterium]|nr:DUF5996 family protein [Anaerolineae bacterium]
MSLLPALVDWDSTRDALHQAAGVLNAIKVPAVARQPNALHHSLAVEPAGLHTGPLAFGGVLRLLFAGGALIPDYPALQWTRAEGESVVIPLSGDSQTTLLHALLAGLADYGITVTPRLDEIVSDVPFALEAALAADYAVALNRLYTALARFRARLNGTMTPLVVWSHHFDLSMLYFVRGRDEHQDPHLNFGFAPASPGLPRPYLYAYAYPMPPGLLHRPLPFPAQWHTDGWTGVVIPYDSLVRYGDPETFIENTLLDIYGLFRQAFDTA